LCRDGDASLRRELDGVPYQVMEYLFDPELVSTNEMRDILG
jgi:hypothetical protein